MKSYVQNFLAVFVFAVLFMGYAFADKTVVYLYDADRTDPDTDESPELPVVNAIVAGTGYQVDLFPTVRLEEATEEELDQLRAADLIIIGRAIGSGNWTEDGRAIWNTLETPVISTNPWAIRNAQLNWMFGGAEFGGDVGDEVMAMVMVPDDPIFDGVDLDEDNQFHIWTGRWNSLGLSTDFPGDGEIMIQNLVNDGADIRAFFVRFEANVPFYESGDVPAGPRTYFGLGDDAGPEGQVFNYWGFSADGATVFLREVERLANYEATGTANVFPAGSFDGYADIDALLAEWTLKNGETEKLELLASDNTIDPNSEKMLKLVAGDNSSNDWDLQLATPLIPLVEGNQYMITFDIRSEGEGQLRVSTGAANQFPDNQYLEHIETDEEWVTARYIFPYGDPNRPILAGEAGAVELNFDMGTVAGMVYYLDNVKVYDITGMGYELNGLNVFPGGTFDIYENLEAALEEWTLKNGETEKLELLESDNTLDDASEKMLKLVAGDNSSNAWDLQLATPLIPLVEGQQYMVSFDIRSEGEGALRISTGAANQIPNNQYWQTAATSEEWTTISYVFLYNDQNQPIVAGPAEAVELNFDMGTVAGMTYYMDNVKVFNITGTKLARYQAPPTSIETPVVEQEAVLVYTQNGNVNIADAAGKAIEIYSVTGVRVFAATGASDTVTVPLSGGIYIVVVNNVAAKVLVK